MKVKMKESVKGSPDGLKVNLYLKDQEYDIPTSLAEVFVDQMKVAARVAIEIEVPKKVKPKTPKKAKIETPEKAEIETPKKVNVEKPATVEYSPSKEK